MLQEKVIKALQQAAEIENVRLLSPKHSDFGDYAVNVHQLRAENTDITPEKIVGILSANPLFEKVEIEGTFINVFLSKKHLSEEVQVILDKANSYGSSTTGQKRTVIIEYSSPNIAKRFSIGHLRSTIIGQSLHNLYSFLGWNVIGDNHIGDWGTQFGKMIIAINTWADKPADQLTIDEMEQLYIKFHEEAEKNPELDEEARQAFKALEDGKKDEKELWNKLVKTSMKDFQKIYDLLGVSIDEAYGESYYEEMMKEIITLSKEKDIAKESEEALVIFFPDDEMPPGMLLKNDGASTYFTRDLATVSFRKKKWNPDLIIYEVGAEQILHFRQVFRAVEMLGIASRDELVHLPHGLIRLKEGKMSTRKGRTIKLDEVLSRAIEKAKELTENEDIAHSIGIGAVKYNDLKRSPITGYVFDWDEILSLEGNSGPYIQYAYARCKSILSQAGSVDYRDPINMSSLEKDEENVLRTLSKFPETVQNSVTHNSPNILCEYLFNLAQTYNAMYNNLSVLKAETEEKKLLRLQLTAATAQILQNGLRLLGIDSPERV